MTTGTEKTLDETLLNELLAKAASADRATMDDKFQELLQACSGVPEFSNEFTMKGLGSALKVFSDNYEANHTERHVPRALIQLFYTLAEKGDPSPLLRKCCSIMDELKLDEYEQNFNVEQIHLGNIKLKDDEIQRSVQSDEHFNNHVKFILLFEMMMCSLNRIETAHCPMYVALVISSLLAVASHVTTKLAASVCLRRVFILARDLRMYTSRCTPQDLWLIRCMFSCFLPKAVSLSLRRVATKYSRRLFQEMRLGVHELPPTERINALQLDAYESRLWDAMSRISQMVYSFDYDPAKVYDLRLNGRLDEIAFLNNSAQNVGDDVIAGYEHLCALDSAGLFVLKTHLSCIEEERPQQSLSTILQELKGIKNEVAHSICLRDAYIYWSLWATRNLTAREVQTCNRQDLEEHLDQLFSLSELCEHCEDRSIASYVAAKILRLQNLPYSLEYLSSYLVKNKELGLNMLVLQLMQSLLSVKRENIRVCRPDFTPEMGDWLLTRLQASVVNSFIALSTGDIGDANSALLWLRLIKLIPFEKYNKTSLITRVNEEFLQQRDQCTELTALAIEREFQP